MDTEEDTYNAIKSLLSKLGDPFTNFYPPARFSSLISGAAGENSIGLSVEFVICLA